MSCGCSSKRDNKSWDMGLSKLFSTELKKDKIKGGRIVLPSEYFGKDSGRYTTNPPQLESGAYGMNHATSHGTLIGTDSDGLSIIGPDLSPAPYATTTQTGGKRKSKRKSSKRKMRKSKRRISKRK
jgi:hypothetical protein